MPFSQIQDRLKHTLPTSVTNPGNYQTVLIHAGSWHFKNWINTFKTLVDLSKLIFTGQASGQENSSESYNHDFILYLKYLKRTSISLALFSCEEFRTFTTFRVSIFLCIIIETWTTIQAGNCSTIFLWYESS